MVIKTLLDDARVDESSAQRNMNKFLTLGELMAFGKENILKLREDRIESWQFY